MEKLIIANWKMNPESIAVAKKLFTEVKKTAGKLSNVKTVIAPPFLYIYELSKLYTGNKIEFASQDVFWEKKGSFTGEIGVSMLKNSGVKYVIVGHSERRALGDNDENINKKILASIQSGLAVILCVGEKNRDNKDGVHLSFLAKQLEGALKDVPQNKISKIIIAYEPIWAIGKNEKDAMKSYELHEMVIFIRKTMVNIFGKNSALKIPILYGGSVEIENTETLLTEGMADGLLVGHASLSAREFSDMLKIVQNI